MTYGCISMYTYIFIYVYIDVYIYIYAFIRTYTYAYLYIYIYIYIYIYTTQQVLCTDGLKNGAEYGIDCGGPCQPCAEGPSCTDGIQNNGEEYWVNLGVWSHRVQASAPFGCSKPLYNFTSTKLQALTLCDFQIHLLAF